jgi:hypothetical protein
MAGISILDLQRCLHSHDSLLCGAYQYGDADRGSKYTATSRIILLSDEPRTALRITRAGDPVEAPVRTGCRDGVQGG